MRVVGVVGAVVLGIASTAVAAEPQQGVPFSLGVNTGVVAGAGPWRAAPSVELTTSVGLGASRFAIIGGVGGWTFHGVGTSSAQSEVIASLGAAMRGGFSHRWGWSVAAAPALAFIDEAQTPTTYRPGLMLSPTLEFSTRRRTLALTVGPRGYIFSDGARLGLVAGVNYTFR